MNPEEFKKLLEEEKGKIEESLKSVGEKTLFGGKEEWTPKYPDLNPLSSDKNEMADEVEEFEQRVGIEGHLEDKLNEINEALSRIKEGNYGICEKCKKEIEQERLKANPSAKTCIKDSK